MSFLEGFAQIECGLFGSRRKIHLGSGPSVIDHNVATWIQTWATLWQQAILQRSAKISIIVCIQIRFRSRVYSENRGNMVTITTITNDISTLDGKIKKLSGRRRLGKSLHLQTICCSSVDSNARQKNSTTTTTSWSHTINHWHVVDDRLCLTRVVLINSLYCFIIQPSNFVIRFWRSSRLIVW